MHINADFSQRVSIDTDSMDWTASPAAGVLRKMLDRIGDEVARATSLVRYASNSSFPEHSHGGGEEFFVLDGVFSDEYGDYPAGSYVRNPIGTKHSPFTRDGCVILVKLHQFDAKDTAQKHIETRSMPFRRGLVEGLSVLPLHQYGHESVALVRWAPGTVFTAHQHYGGEEIFVIDGVFQDENGTYPKNAWLRSPHNSVHAPYSDEGCLILVKTGHLPAN